MWQPTRAQWSIVCVTAALLVFGWPPAEGHSLGMTTLRWLADPAGTLPEFPPPLPMAVDDDGDVVAAHDALEAEYYRVHNRSRLLQWRMDLKRAGEPFDATTTRQLLVGLAVAGALAAWRLDRSAKR
jgi:hypothetical protein